MRTRVGSDDSRRWVRSLRLGNPYAKAVLMAFANYTNDDGTSYPGLETIHGDTEIAINTITARLRWCETIGAITISKCWVDEHGNRNKVGRGRPTSWEIRFLLDANVEAIAAAAEDQTPERPLRGAALETHEKKVREESGVAAETECADSPDLGHSPGEPLNSDLPISSQSVANHLPITGATRILESESEKKDSIPKPLSKDERGFQAIDEETEKRFEEFKRTYPQGILDLDAAHVEFVKLPKADQTACLKGVVVYGDRCRARKEKSMKAHLFVRKRCWDGLLADPKVASPSSHPVNSDAGRALMALGRVMNYSPLVLTGNVIGDVTPRVRALATAPPIEQWKRASKGSGNYAAWRELAWSVWPGKGFAFDSIDIPWDWPPRKDGSIITSGTAPPGELSDEDVAALSGT